MQEELGTPPPAGVAAQSSSECAKACHRPLRQESQRTGRLVALRLRQRRRGVLQSLLRTVGADWWSQDPPVTEGCVRFCAGSHKKVGGPRDATQTDHCLPVNRGMHAKYTGTALETKSSPGR